MVDAELLRCAGLFVMRDFLPVDLCARLRDEAARSRLHKAGIFRGEKILMDERIRRTEGACLPETLQSAIDERFQTIMPDLGRHFDHVLTGRQPAQLLAYQRGSFFRPHQDNSGSSGLPPDVTDRLVSAVVFLGRQTRLPEPGSYCGGALTFFRLRGPGGTNRVRTEVWGEEGLLVAFPATGTIHEVRPVTHGPRYSLVTWFTGGDRSEQDAGGT
ncbi:2OG-Fe(II) oxygenase [Actinomadura chokoriensis]|uniref:2OG-Fe(II) oxygenase n=1 Tax=Actinomadura chokoriensis TaxID=454156 RepID=A0ABV4R3J4_9ACTN